MTGVTIAGQVAAMAEPSAGQPPGKVMGAFAREQAELAAGGIPEGPSWRVLCSLTQTCSTRSAGRAPASCARDETSDQPSTSATSITGWCAPIVCEGCWSPAYRLTKTRMLTT